MTLTKADLPQKIADDCGFLEGETRETVEKMMDIIKSRFKAGEDLIISTLMSAWLATWMTSGVKPILIPWDAAPRRIPPREIAGCKCARCQFSRGE